MAKQASKAVQRAAINRQTWQQRMKSYRRTPVSLLLFLLVCSAAVITVGVLALLIGYILVKGLPNLHPSLFAWSYSTENVSMLPALINTILMVLLSLVIAAPVGIFSAIYLVEYAKRGNKLVELIRLTTETLQGIPSIVYGLFGALFFVKALGWQLSLLAGAFTLAIMILPLIMRTTRGGAEGSAGQLSGGQLWLRRRTGAHGISHYITHCSAGYFGGHYFSRWPNCGRIGSADFFRRHYGRCAWQCV